MEDIPSHQVVVNQPDVGMEIESNERRDLETPSYMITKMRSLWGNYRVSKLIMRNW